ncbi:MAG: hypothetical protein N2255_00310 [Kiritimatiellae bacterium]|nr:hypothetical protein [Kiritimatiellia bacterium]
MAEAANRTNTFNWRIYKEDPTIFARRLANEPRCKTDPSGIPVRDWTYEMAAYLKAVDTNHMVSTGEEGWTSNEPWGACPLASELCLSTC